MVLDSGGGVDKAQTAGTAMRLPQAQALVHQVETRTRASTLSMTGMREAQAVVAGEWTSMLEWRHSIDVACACAFVGFYCAGY